MKALVKNAADEEQVREARAKEKRGRERELDDVRFVLSNPQGRRFFWRYLGECGVFKTSFSASGSTTFYLEGKRGVGLRLLEDVNEAEPTAYVTMMTEARKEENG